MLFLDEALEFRPSVHDALRQPLESGEISIRRSDGAATFPARFQLILAANPCPCGGDVTVEGAVRVQLHAIERRQYRERISGPVRDRIDIVHNVLPVSRPRCGSRSATTGAPRRRRAGARGARPTGTPFPRPALADERRGPGRSSSGGAARFAADVALPIENPVARAG